MVQNNLQDDYFATEEIIKCVEYLYYINKDTSYGGPGINF